MKILILSGLLIGSVCQGQQTRLSTLQKTTSSLDRPKLVVGLVVDQMRWDYLYRYYDRYSEGGFKRLLKEGFSVENTFIPYAQTSTAPGHACIYTGSVPAINGIIGNSWYVPALDRIFNCVEDSTVRTVGSNTHAGRRSPSSMLSNTITDELRLASNFRSKVIGIAIKDRSAILPAGHSANAAYWYDGHAGKWITSTHYVKQLPTWLDSFNLTKPANKYYKHNWSTLYPIETYRQSTADEKPYEGTFNGEAYPVFVHTLSSYIDRDFDMVKNTPFGNTLTLEMARLAIRSERMGLGTETDFLTVSFSSTDYIGHQFGPNSIEVEDTYLRLDKDLEQFFQYLDRQVGKGKYLLFLTADHGVAHNPAFLNENRLTGGHTHEKVLIDSLNKILEARFNIHRPILGFKNNQIYFNHKKIDEDQLDFELMKRMSIDFLKWQKGFLTVVDLATIGYSSLPEKLKHAISNGYNPRRSGDLFYILDPNWFEGNGTGATHGAWNPYDSHIPLLFMGWNVTPGKTNKMYQMTDIAPTLAAMLKIQMPNGSIGIPIEEILP